MKKSFLICLLAAVTCALATPALQAANTDSSKPGLSRVAQKTAKNKKKHHKHAKHAMHTKRTKQNPASF